LTSRTSPDGSASSGTDSGPDFSASPASDSALGAVFSEVVRARGTSRAAA